ncbi:MFS transporter [Streptomyces sp. NPDC048564]|uniref:MFS transporter n=1 Tax=unclassified Streptomyces TaxID=2593676 RepID=UPI0034286F3D
MNMAGRLAGRAKPYHALVAGALLTALGQGMYSAASIIYFTRLLGLSVGQVGLALSAAGAMGFLATVPLGRLVDEIGARRTAVVLQIAKAVLVAALAVIQSFWLFLVAAALLGAATRGGQVAWQALVADVVGPQQRVRVQALTRSAFNGGVSVGVLAAAPVIVLTDRGPFVAMLLGVALCYLLVSQVTARLPVPHQAVRKDLDVRPARPGTAFVLLGFVTGFLGLHISILEIAIPLWVLQQADVPESAVSLLLFVNTVLVIALQVPLSRSSKSVRGSTITLAVSGAVVAASCVVFALTHGLGGWSAIALLVSATVLLTLGEVLQSAASWGLGFELSPVGGRGGHLGAFALGSALQDIVGPGLVTFVLIQHPPEGWWLLAVALVAGGLVAIPLARRAQRHLIAHTAATAQTQTVGSAEQSSLKGGTTP